MVPHIRGPSQIPGDDRPVEFQNMRTSVASILNNHQWIREPDPSEVIQCPRAGDIGLLMPRPSGHHSKVGAIIRAILPSTGHNVWERGVRNT
eukprot:SM000092S24511  [mRNA]  locus=s92:311801:313648:- [translate_table: standard]